MSKSGDRGRIILEALVAISRLDASAGAEMKRISVEALVEIGVIRVMPIEEPRVTLQ